LLSAGAGTIDTLFCQSRPRHAKAAPLPRGRRREMTATAFR